MTKKAHEVQKYSLDSSNGRVVILICAFGQIENAVNYFVSMRGMP